MKPMCDVPVDPEWTVWTKVPCDQLERAANSDWLVLLFVVVCVICVVTYLVMNDGLPSE